MSWTFERDVLSDFERAESLEWLETNGLGGWAASTATGAHSRRYHGLLVAATAPPVGRMVLMSRLDETVITEDCQFDLGTCRFPGVIHPRGHERMERFRRGTFPEFEYRAGRIGLRKTLACVDGENTTLVLYEVAEGSGPVTLVLRPFFAGRDYHSLTRANDAIRREGSFHDGVLAFRAYDGQPTTFVTVPGAIWDASPDWWRDFEYSRERERGLDHREDLFTPGAFRVRLEDGGRLGVRISTEPPDGREAFALLEEERSRRGRLQEALAGGDDLCRALAAAADQFIVRRGSDLRTVIAGYPWFTDWGRDTMIALPGLCLVTGRVAEAGRILQAFARAVDRGMVPNRFPDGGESPEYNTADASLWFFVAVWRYLEAGGDGRLVRGELLPVLRQIVNWHRRGTRHGIREDSDGLLRAGEPGAQLTWMDAKVGDWTVTPRHGKPVEINALWYNALCILAGIERRLGDATQAPGLEASAGRVKRRFAAAFWNESAGCLYDVVDGDTRDASLRPNQILAIGLPHPVVTGTRARRLLKVVEDRLLTPVGLRTLASDDPVYRGRYEGDVPSRDGAYHQGTVWPWLLGPYLDAVVRVRGEAGRRSARALLQAFARHLGEAGVGTVSEIFDADPPHAPRGCPAQAWSVAEILRGAVEVAGLAAGMTVSPATNARRAVRRSRTERAREHRAPDAPR